MGAARYKPYPAYKASGVEWIGDIPEGWEACSARMLFTVQSGDMLPASRVTENGVRVVGGNGFRGYTDRSNTKPGTLVIGRVGAKCGCIHVIREPFWASEHAFKVIPRADYDIDFMAYYLDVLNLNQFAITTAQPLLNTEIVTSKAIVLPKNNLEQTKIAAFLEYETGKIDALIAKQERLIALLEEKRQAVISHAVTKGLNPNAPLRPSGIDWLGDVPEHWEVKPLKHCSNIRYGIGEPPKYHDKGTPLIRATNIRSGKISPVGLVLVDPADIPPNRIVWLKAGDIVVVRSGATTGDSSIIPGEYGNSIAGFDMVVRPIGCMAEYLGFALLSNYLRTNQIDLETTRAAQPHLNAEELGNCFVILPSFPEQREIVTFISSELKKFDELMLKATTTVTLLKERRTALISAAVTGKIDVRDWQPPEGAKKSITQDISTQDIDQTQEARA